MRSAIYQHAIHTPLIPLYNSATQNILLKLENLQPFGSYKIRGIANLISQLSAQELSQGLTAASAGNMGQAVAYLAKKLNLACTIVVPEAAPSIKVKAIEALGATVIKKPFDAVWRMVQEGESKEIPGYFIHPANNQFLTEGYASIAAELLTQEPALTDIIIPFGVGGLTLGIARYIKSQQAAIRVHTVEPETAAPLHHFITSGKTYIERQPSFIDAIGTPEVISSVREQVVNYIDSAQVVSVSETQHMVKKLYQQHKIIVEGAGAAPVVAAQNLCASTADVARKVACIISGGNIDTQVLRAIVEG